MQEHTNKPTNRRMLLASDMDGTVIPLDQQPCRSQEIAEFRQAVESAPHLMLAYVTGRRLELAREGVQQFALPEPHILGCDVGTTLYTRQEEKWEVVESYREEMKTCMGGHTGDAVVEVLRDEPALTPQEPECQAEFKRSYYVPLELHDTHLTEHLKTRLEARGIKANLVYSVDPKKNIGLLDVLPAGVAKDHAIAFLQRHLDIEKDDLIYAGDSGNDLHAFLSGFKAIVVGNTPERVCDLVKKQSSGTPLSERIYFARHYYARGVLEGCRHFGVF